MSIDENNETKTMDQSECDQPSRRSSRRSARKTTTLAGSFKQFMDTTPSNEVDEFSHQLQSALGAVSPALSASFTLKQMPPPEALLMEDDAEAGGETASNNAGAVVPPSPSMGGAIRRPSGEAYYTPISTSRRNSRAGSEIAMSMKLNAAAVIAELGDISSDDDDDDDFLGEGPVPLPTEEYLVPLKGFGDLSVEK